MRGTVKWWQSAKGFGFIRAADGTDHFVHFSAIQGSGRRDLLDGQHVEFDAVMGAKGPAALNVRVIA